MKKHDIDSSRQLAVPKQGIDAETMNLGLWVHDLRKASIIHLSKVNVYPNVIHDILQWEFDENF